MILYEEDLRGQSHAIRLTLPPMFPMDSPDVSMDIPTKVDIVDTWNKDDGVVGLVESCKAILDSCCQFWEILDDIDTHLIVIEPQNPSRACTYRRIYVEGSVILEVRIDDPLNPSQVPDMTLLGPDQKTIPMKLMMSTRIQGWDDSMSMVENLDRLFDKPMPRGDKHDRPCEPHTMDPAVEQMACAICYSYSLPTDDASDEGKFPNIFCENSKCGKPFHMYCLKEWLLSDPSSRHSFSTLFGKCPFCSGPIQAKLE